VREHTWSGATFSNPTAQAYWNELPPTLRAIAQAEIAAGNDPVEILRNGERGIVLLGFARGPLAGAPLDGITIHSVHRYGNYCYDGTKCTFEDRGSGCFLAFADPDWNESEGLADRPPNA
jgi:hypothetical protein